MFTQLCIGALGIYAGYTLYNALLPLTYGVYVPINVYNEIINRGSSCSYINTSFAPGLIWSANGMAESVLIDDRFDILNPNWSYIQKAKCGWFHGWA